MSERHGLTLRKKRSKRPQISAPTAATGTGLARNAGANSTAQQKERAPATDTADLVKRRYSTRYNQLPQFGLDAPDVPALPNQLKRRSASPSPQRPRSAQSQHAHPLKVDQAVLADPLLQHERYVADLLSNASQEDIQEYQNSLRRIKNRTSLDLQQSVYQNRTQFIKISKEAERLRGEMAVLRGLMGELTTALGQSTTNATSSLSGGTATRRAANRSSVANLESMWSTQLQQLWKHVEKSQKFLPAVPGRHIVMETGSWIELDSATWKPKRPVHVVLLNDHILVASKKRKKLDPNVPNQGPAPTKLVAEECFPLGDIDVVDMAATVSAASTPAEERAISTAITIRSGNRSLTYRHEKRVAQAKQELLMALRKAIEDLRKANVPAQGKSNLKNDALNYLAVRDPASAANPEVMDSLTKSRSKPDILIEVDGKQENFRWVESQIDELDINIALQRFQEAVDQVERLRLMAKGLSKSNAVAQELINVQLDERATKLASMLYRDLVDTPSFIEATKRTTGHLIRLGFEDKARDLYLVARGDTLTKRARQCVFDGDLHRYVFSISYVYFTIVRNTVTIFQACFPPPTMSACIKWCNEHLETFNALLVRQLSCVEAGGKVWRDCMDVVWSHEREMLGDVGLDFREVIGRGLSSSSSSETGSVESNARSFSSGTATAVDSDGGRGRIGRGIKDAKTRSHSRSKSRPRNVRREQ